jgi:hypothetical protein
MLLDAATALLVTLLVPALVLAPGLALARRATEGLLPSERLALAAAFGLGLLGVTLFTVGLLRYSALTLGGMVALFGLGWLSTNIRREFVALVRTLLPPRWPWAALLGLLLGYLFLSGLADPVGHQGHDGISYHLLGPRVWLREQRIVPIPDFSCTAFPASVEAIFGALMAFSSARAPGALGAVYVALLLVQTHGLARWAGSTPTFAMLATCAVATMPVAVVLSTSAFVDVPFAVYALAALRVGLLQSNAAGVLVGGAFTGFAMGTKYTGLPLAFGLLVISVAGVVLRREYGNLRSVALGTALGTLLALPFYLKNYIVLGSPIYPPPPALYDYFDVPYFPRASAVALEHYSRVERGLGFGRGALDLLLLPWRFSMYPATFHGAGGIGLFPLALGPVGWWVGRKRAGMFELLAWILFLVIVWFATQQEARFVIHLVVVGAALGAVGAGWLAVRSKVGLALIVAVTGISMIYGGATLFKELRSAALGAVSAAHARKRLDEIPFRSAFDALNALDTAHVLIFDPMVPPYYLKHRYQKTAGMYRETPFVGPMTLERLYELGITHVFETDKHPAPDWLAAHLDVLLVSGGARVSRLRSGRADRALPTTVEVQSQ